MNEWEKICRDVASRFVGLPMTDTTVCALRVAIVAARELFLAENKELCALGDVMVHLYGHHVSVTAEVCTRAEKLRLDNEQRKLDQSREELLGELERSREMDRKSYASLLRRHRKLTRKCLTLVPPSTRRMWETLSVPQQYAILKDVDYRRRHKG